MLITIPLRFLLLALANITGIDPPPDIPPTQMVVVKALPNAAHLGQNCWSVGYLDPVCTTGQAKPGDHVLNANLWRNPKLMQHVALHEYGHTLYGGDQHEAEAEAYACKWVPMRIVVQGGECRP